MIIILMATYNGSNFVREQLNSILGQTYESWNLYIRDDNSNDGTASILEEYVRMDSRINLLPKSDSHHSAVANFSALFDYVYNLEWDYIMFADQDDVWLPNKIQDSKFFIEEKEAQLVPLTPVMTFSDFQYINIDNENIAESLKMPHHLSLPNLINENHAYGCTIIFNKPLSKKIVSIPLSAENHDYWIALVACCFGKTYLNKAKLLRYRQHSNNVSGGVKNRTLISRFTRYALNVNYLLPLLIKRIKMMQLFYSHYELLLKGNDVSFFKGYFSSIKKNNFVFFWWMISNGIKKVGMMPTLAHYYIILVLQKKISKHV